MMIKRTAAHAIVLMIMLFFSMAGAVAAAEFNFSIDIPEGWWRVNTDKYLVITKDGAFRHYILVQERPLLLPFMNTGKTLKPDSLPSEVAQVIVDELVADPNLTELQLIENIPATVAGRPGFQLTFLYTDPAGIVFKTVYYGCIQGDRFYNLRYSASEQSYFEQEAWRVFSGVRNSFQIN
jgi:hypothetical protein